MKKSMIIIALVGLSSLHLIAGNGPGPRFHTFQGELSISLTMGNDMVYDYCAQEMRYPFTAVVKSTSTVVSFSSYPILLNFQFGQSPIMVYKAGTRPVLANKIAVIHMWTIGVDTVRGYFLMGVPGNIELPGGGSPFTVSIAPRFSQGLDVYQVQDNPRNNSASVSVQTNVHVSVPPSPFDHLTGIAGVVEDVRMKIYGYIRMNTITGNTVPFTQTGTSFVLFQIHPSAEVFYIERAGCFARTGTPYYHIMRSGGQCLRYESNGYIQFGYPAGDSGDSIYHWVFRQSNLQDGQGHAGRFLYNVAAGTDSSLWVTRDNFIAMAHHDDEDFHQVFYFY